MIDEGSLLATLAQSSAAVVAIVGGFLVSRLVQLSSEREGLRRQLVRARDKVKHVAAAYDEARKYRLTNSRRDFYRQAIEDIVRADPATVDRAALLASNIPHGNSVDEIAPYLDELVDEVARVKKAAAQYLHRDDADTLDLDDQRGRGLRVPEAQETTYAHVVDWMADQLPPSQTYALGVMPRLSLTNITNVSEQSAELRRLDESIRDEQDLRSRKTMLEAEVARVKREINIIGRPVGVPRQSPVYDRHSLQQGQSYGEAG
jgi:hypothetical protein